MNLDTTIFFVIVIGGVISIWSFRRTAGRTDDMKEIEYLAFTSILGTIKHKLLRAREGTHRSEPESNHVTKLRNPFGSPSRFG